MPWSLKCNIQSIKVPTFTCLVGLLINYPGSNRWVGVFIGFASQAVHTDEETGHAVSLETWSDYLEPETRNADLIKNAVTIDQAVINTSGSTLPPGRRTSITLKNFTGHKMPLFSWKI
jgi:hypothetical protein